MCNFLVILGIQEQFAHIDSHLLVFLAQNTE